MVSRRAKGTKVPQRQQPSRAVDSQEQGSQAAEQLVQDEEAIRIAALTLRNILRGDQS